MMHPACRVAQAFKRRKKKKKKKEKERKGEMGDRDRGR
jgi:hypothetical protein